MKNLRSNIKFPHIYKITNLLNGKIYIGKHKGTSTRYVSGGRFINNSINKNGSENFKKSIIVFGNFNEKLLNELEKHYIRLFNSNDRKIGYNLTKGGDGVLGLVHSEETKIKISSNMKGIPKSESTKKKISKIHKGKLVSKETCKRISESKLGTEPWNKGLKGVQIAWNKGIPHSKVTKERLSKNSARKGKPAYNRKKIAVFDLNNNLLCEVEHRGELREKGFFNLSKIQKVLNGQIESWNGFKYKHV